ncbi:MAG TPA: hypothetical protein VGG39_15875 [Polyangiaceae bacterium]|jgi:hypothetical protein
MDDKRTCTAGGREHLWERKGATEGGGASVFFCPTCTAWGWSTPRTGGRVREYAQPFVSHAPKATPTAAPVTVRNDGKPETHRRIAEEEPRRPSYVDVRADRPVRRKGEYSPPFGLDDWDRGVGYRRRGGA